MEAFENGDAKRLFDIDAINDSTINVKLIVDSLFKNNPQLLTKAVYRVTDYVFKQKTNQHAQVLNFREISEIGFRLSERTNDKYILKIDFEFEDTFNKEEYCWCGLMNEKEYGFVIPFTVKN
jgi:hypothetical protein